MQSRPTITFPRLPSAEPPWLSPDAEALHESAPLRSAFADAAASLANAYSPAEARSAAVAALDAAVRVYVARCKEAGMPSERVLIRVSDVTRRHAVVSLSAAHAVALRDVVFCAFLIAFYGDGRVRCPPAAARAPHEGAGQVPPAGDPREKGHVARRDRENHPL